ncbi:MAG: UvrD-helicase domain-containing protein [Planctomycetia bacterium]|nr:UvrD-helicase domain-containing protein [Planctomycetia bacterium]
MSSLNPAQAEAVHTLRGPLLVLAGAGSGKTRVVTLRIAELIKHGILPERILAVTFTNKAATEMLQRVGQILYPSGKPSSKTPVPEISTFHSLCVRILRRNITCLGFPETFAIYDRGDQESMASRVLKEIACPEASLKNSDFLSIVSRWKSASVLPYQASRIAQTDKEHLAASAYRRYQTAMKACGAVDFDDILLLTEELFEKFPEVREKEALRFDHILVDEYQDTNQSQYRIIKALAAGHRNLCVVGDDDQSIYAWRGAEVTHILRFGKDWPDAKVVRLEMNYRSTHEIILWANRVVAFNRQRHPKTLRATLHGEMPRVLQCADAEEEATQIVSEIRRRIQMKIRKPREIAILFRTNEQPRAFEMEFQRQKVPYTLIGGQSFFDRKEVRDLLAYLRVIVNPKDEMSLLRIMNTPPRGIGQTSIIRMVENALANKLSLWEAVESPEFLQLQVKLNPKTLAAVQDFRGMINGLRKTAKKMPMDEFIRQMISIIDYRSEIERFAQKESEQQMRWNLVEELANSAASYMQKEEDPRLYTFVQQLALMDRNMSDGNEKEPQSPPEGVVLMTLHAAKGLEFPEVYLVGMEEGILPHKRSLESYSEKEIAEERRLCYVGITRAKTRLTVSMALQRMKWGKMRDTIPSRFLYEMTGQSENPNYLSVLRGENPKKKR